ncbi:MAG: hypothetical protein ACLT98_06370 [Eggerthellaceae bacterium]
MVDIPILGVAVGTIMTGDRPEQLGYHRRVAKPAATPAPTA